MTAPEPVLIGCTGGCGRKTPADDIERSGWSFLHITGRYRCGGCERDLERAAHAAGAPSRNDVDPLPSDSLGALKKLPERQLLHERVKP